MTSGTRFRVFVLMLFREDMKNFYQLGIKEVITGLGGDCQRVDEQIFEESILQRIYGQIAAADLIIADMSDRNPNVYYETGYAHALNKRVILLTQHAKDIPFDLKHYPHIIYGKSVTKLKRQLKTHVSWYLANSRSARAGALSVPKVRRFSSLAETYDYITEQVLASSRIDDISWGQPGAQEKSLADRDGYERYLAAKESVLREKNCVFREIFTFPGRERFERARKLIEKRYHGYNACYFPESGNPGIPRLSFILFDSTSMVIFLYMNDHRSSYKEVRIAITDSQIVGLFQDYYDHAYSNGVTLKEAQHVNSDALERLDKTFGLA